MVAFKSIADIMKTDLLKKNTALQTDDKVIRHNKIEDLIYKEKRQLIDEELTDIESQGVEKLKSIKSLTQDMFNSLYNITPELKSEDELSNMAKEFNKMIVEKTMQTDEYPVLKQLTEGKDFESIEGAKEFMQNIVSNLDELLKNVSGEKETLKIMDKMEQQIEKLQEELQGMTDQYKDLQDKGIPAEQLEKKILETANQLSSKNQQYNKLQEIIAINKLKNKDKIDEAIQASMQATLDKVEDIQETLSAWGTEEVRNGKMEVKKELYEKVNKSQKLKDMAKIIGKYREIAAEEMKNSYVYGRGEKYDIELGNDINRLITSEYVNLALPETRPLFIKKYQNKQLKQYSRREPITKGCGKKIVCIDESGSTKGGKDAWAKAITMALMDITMKNSQNFAVIHFSKDILTHEVNKENYSTDYIMEIATTFLDGGTDFDKPLSKSCELLQDEKYKGADIVFITDGECDISEKVLNEVINMKKAKKAKVIGVLLDKGVGSVSDLTLKKFCDKIYKSSQLSEDTIAENIIKSAV